MPRGFTEPERHPSDTGFYHNECLTLQNIYKQAAKYIEVYPLTMRDAIEATLQLHTRRVQTRRDETARLLRQSKENSQNQQQNK